MFVPEKLKLNKFRLVRLPKPVDYVGRFGLVPSPGSKYSGDEVFSSTGTKTELLAQAESHFKSESSKSHKNEK